MRHQNKFDYYLCILKCLSKVSLWSFLLFQHWRSTNNLIINEQVGGSVLCFLTDLSAEDLKIPQCSSVVVLLFSFTLSSNHS